MTPLAVDVPLPGDSERWLFTDWAGVWRVLLSASLAYAATALLFRLAGTRSASQMNNFDWVVTVAMGAIVGATALRDGTVVAEGAAAVVALLFWQWALNFAAVRSGWFHDLMFHTPQLLYHDGEFLRSAMRSQRISEDEVLRAVRLAGEGVPERGRRRRAGAGRSVERDRWGRRRGAGCAAGGGGNPAYAGVSIVNDPAGPSSVTLKRLNRFLPRTPSSTSSMRTGVLTNQSEIPNATIAAVTGLTSPSNPETPVGSRSVRPIASALRLGMRVTSAPVSSSRSTSTDCFVRG